MRRYRQWYIYGTGSTLDRATPQPGAQSISVNYAYAVATWCEYVAMIDAIKETPYGVLGRIRIVTQYTVDTCMRREFHLQQERLLIPDARSSTEAAVRFALSQGSEIITTFGIGCTGRAVGVAEYYKGEIADSTAIAYEHTVQTILDLCREAGTALIMEI